MIKNLKIYCPDESTQEDVVRWLVEFWEEELTLISTWTPDPVDSGTWGIFADGANEDLYDDLLEVFEGCIEAEWEE